MTSRIFWYWTEVITNVGQENDILMEKNSLTHFFSLDQRSTGIKCPHFRSLSIIEKKTATIFHSPHKAPFFFFSEHLF